MWDEDWLYILNASMVNLAFFFFSVFCAPLQNEKVETGTKGLRIVTLGGMRNADPYTLLNFLPVAYRSIPTLTGK